MECADCFTGGGSLKNFFGPEREASSVRIYQPTLRGLDFELRSISVIYVKPLNKGKKNDYNDAEAIAEAGCV